MRIDKNTIKLARRAGCKILSENKIECKGKKITIVELPKSKMGGPFFGHSYRSEHKIEIREDLSQDVKNHVLLHEIGHQIGLSSEIDANEFAFMRDPIGFLKTVKDTMRDPDRVDYYVGKFKNRK